MLQHIWAPALAILICVPAATDAASLAPTANSDFWLHAQEQTSSGWLFDDALQFRQAVSSDQNALAAAELKVLARSARLAIWTGAQAMSGMGASASVRAVSEIMLLPDEGERSGTPVLLNAQLIARSYQGAIVYGIEQNPSVQLSAIAQVGPYFDSPLYTFTGSEVVQIPAVIGSPVRLLLDVAAGAGAAGAFAFDSYAAMDLQLVISFDSIVPSALTPWPTVLGDATLDGLVDIADYTVWADNFFSTTTEGGWRGDFNRDGIVDTGDYTLWADNYSPGVAPLSTSAVPEPATWSLALLAAGIGLVARQCGQRR